jgi:hypothetical protein
MSDADAAAVASKLLDFYREPARYRPRYVNGQETIAGPWVFKFAQARFPHGIVRSFGLEERQSLREAACAFIRQVCFRDAASHYDVLGVQPGARPETVKANYHLLMALIHPDRQDARAGAWPAGCAQRVNQAYAVLSDERLRRDYETSLRKIGNGAAHAAQAVQGEDGARVPIARAPSPRRRRRSAIRAVMLVTAVMATFLLVQLVLVSELPAEYRLLERAYPLEASAQWMRSVFSSSEPPRFLTENAVLPRATDVAEEPPEAKPPRRRAQSAPPVEVEPVMPATVEPRKEPPRAAPATPAPIRVALEAPAIAQALAPATALTNADIEALVAHLVSSYEAGDIDALMALVDRAEASSLRGARMRQLYDEFFRATRERHLRVNALAWQVEAASAQARGEVAVSAHYFDRPAALERRVPVELDIAMREGRPRITRLALFPDGR